MQTLSKTLCSYAHVATNNSGSKKLVILTMISKPNKPFFFTKDRIALFFNNCIEKIMFSVVFKNHLINKINDPFRNFPYIIPNSVNIYHHFLHITEKGI